MINLWAYNLETVLAEKLETILARSDTNTRMRDFYDIHVLYQVFRGQISYDNLQNAFIATTKQRDSIGLLPDVPRLLLKLKQSENMEQLWSHYSRKYDYANGISWTRVLTSVREVFNMANV